MRNQHRYARDGKEKRDSLGLDQNGSRVIQNAFLYSPTCHRLSLSVGGCNAGWDQAHFLRYPNQLENEALRPNEEGGLQISGVLISLYHLDFCNAEDFKFSNADGHPDIQLRCPSQNPRHMQQNSVQQLSHTHVSPVVLFHRARRPSHSDLRTLHRWYVY